MSAPDIPTEYTIHTDDDLLSDIRIKELQPIKLGGSVNPIKTESKIEELQLKAWERTEKKRRENAGCGQRRWDVSLCNLIPADY